MHNSVKYKADFSTAQAEDLVENACRMFISKRAKYGYTVTPDHTDHGKSAEVVTASDPAKFMEVTTAPFIAPHNRSR